jgi:3-oxoacyl-[acyl-carrier protein] reductase
LRLLGKVALVTGAGSGIGRECAATFAREGAYVACVDISLAGATSTVRFIEEAGGKAFAIRADVGVETEVAAMMATTVDRLGRLDVLHNNAGVSLVQRLEDFCEADWDRVFAVNLKSAFMGVKYAIPYLKETRGAIVNTASTAATRPREEVAAYSATKAGIIALTKVAARELAPDGIRVNCVCPVATDTPSQRHWLGKWAAMQGVDVTEANARLAASIPLGHTASTRDIADAVLFLVSDEARMITGTALAVDGGFLS